MHVIGTPARAVVTEKYGMVLVLKITMGVLRVIEVGMSLSMTDVP